MDATLQAVTDKLAILHTKIDDMGEAWKADIAALKLTVAQQELDPEAQRTINAALDEITKDVDDRTAEAKAAAPVGAGTTPTSPQLTGFIVLLPRNFVSVEAGKAVPFEVSARAGDGGLFAGYRGVVNVAAGPVQPDYRFGAADNGIHDFTAEFSTAGAQTITVRDIATGITGSVTVNVVDAPPVVTPPASSPAVSFATGMVPSPRTVAIGERFSVQVTPKSAAGATDTAYVGKVALAGAGINFTESGTEFQFSAADNGSHLFNKLMASQSGTLTITVSDQDGLNGSMTVQVS